MINTPGEGTSEADAAGVGVVDGCLQLAGEPGKSLGSLINFDPPLVAVSGGGQHGVGVGLGGSRPVSEQWPERDRSVPRCPW
jgi:hypothetical protein